MPQWHGDRAKNLDPTFTNEEVLPIYVFGLIEKRATVGKICEHVDDDFSEWLLDLPAQKSYNRCICRLSTVFAPFAQEALSEIEGKKTRGQMVRIAESMPIVLAKGQRASKAEVTSDRLASVDHCFPKNTFGIG